jgi:hypothetical protein
MKATLEFNLPEDRIEYTNCIKSSDMARFIFELTYNTKKRLISKYDDTIIGNGPEQGIDDVFDLITDLLVKYNIDLNQLV